MEMEFAYISMLPSTSYSLLKNAPPFHSALTMRSVAALLTLIVVSVSSFGIPQTATTTHRRHASSSWALQGLVQKEEMTEELIKIEEYRANWNRIRHLEPEEIINEPQEYQDAYKRFYDRLDSDMERMMEIANKLEKILEPKQLKKKSKAQRKRDKWAREQAYRAGEAAAAAKLQPNLTKKAEQTSTA